MWFIFEGPSAAGFVFTGCRNTMELCFVLNVNIGRLALRTFDVRVPPGTLDSRISHQQKIIFLVSRLMSLITTVPDGRT
jgi:hypothetical protein